VVAYVIVISLKNVFSDYGGGKGKDGNNKCLILFH
jgi:hypothetical protein